MRHGSVASIKPTVENRSEIDFQENIFRQNVINDLQKVTKGINSYNMTSGMSSISDHLSDHHFFLQNPLQALRGLQLTLEYKFGYFLDGFQFERLSMNENLTS